MYTEKNILVKNRKAFTLVEVIVTITILGLIFSSVMSVFMYYSTLGAKVEVNRIIQSNIKTIIEHITEDIREHGINVDHTYKIGNTVLRNNNHYFDSKTIIVGPNTQVVKEKYDISTDKLRVGEHYYYIGKEDGIIVSDQNDCVGKTKDHNCFLWKKSVMSGSQPSVAISNSWVAFRKMNFYVSNDNVPKVTMVFDMKIANGKGIKQGLVDASSIKIQTTISEKLLDNN